MAAQGLVVFFAGAAHDAVAGFGQHVAGLVDLGRDFAQGGLVAEQKQVFLGQPHFQEIGVEVVLNLHEAQLVHHPVHVVLGEDGQKKQQGEADAAAHDELGLDFHALSPRGSMQRGVRAGSLRTGQYHSSPSTIMAAPMTASNQSMTESGPPPK